MEAPTIVVSKSIDAFVAALLMAARSGGVVGVGEGDAVPDGVCVCVCVGVAVSEALGVGLDVGLARLVCDGVGVRVGVIDAGAPNESDGVGVAEGVVDSVGVCVGAVAILNEFDESV